MRAFYVYSRPISGKSLNLDEAPVFLNSSFSWEAFFFSQLWLVFHRMWHFLLFTVPLQLLLYQCSTAIHYPFSFLLTLILPLSFGFLAHEMRETHLIKNGYRLYTIIMAENSTVAQLKLFKEESLSSN